eukprot:429585-Rhodomonas_salina.1
MAQHTHTHPVPANGKPAVPCIQRAGRRGQFRTGPGGFLRSVVALHCLLIYCARTTSTTIDSIPAVPHIAQSGRRLVPGRGSSLRSGESTTYRTP